MWRVSSNEYSKRFVQSVVQPVVQPAAKCTGTVTDQSDLIAELKALHNVGGGSVASLRKVAARRLPSTPPAKPRRHVHVQDDQPPSRLVTLRHIDTALP